MRKLTVIILLIFILSPSVFAGEGIKVSLPKNNTGTALLGMGVEFDPHFFSQNLTRNDGATEADWFNVVVPRVQMMGIQRFRVMLLPHWWEPYNDNGDPYTTDYTKLTLDSPEVQSVCHVLDLAQSIDADVTLVLWGCPISAASVDPKIGYIGRHFLSDPKGKGWVTGCNNNEEFAENFIIFVDWLINAKGYTCIKEITPYNEPECGVSSLNSYVPTAKALDSRLRRMGLREKVKLNLSDNTDVRRWFLRGVAGRLSDVADVFNSHTYIFGYGNPNSDALNWEKQNRAIANRLGKPHYVGEFGSNMCVGATRQTDINWYERGVLIARNVINFLNGGAAGCSYWGLIDQYYGKEESYRQMQQLGLWRYKENAYQKEDLFPGIDGDYAVRPHYFSYSLFTRFIRKGSTVYPLNLNNEFAAGTAVKNADGKWTYAFANANDVEHTYIVEAGSSADCGVYVYSRSTLPRDDKMIEESSIVNAVGGTYTITVPAESVVFLVQNN